MWRYVAVMILVLLVVCLGLPQFRAFSVFGTSLPTSRADNEFLDLELGQGWEVGHSAEVPHEYSITEFIREGDSINDWKELLTIQTFPISWGGPFPEDTVNMLKAVRERRCPGATRWSIIAKDEKSILYEWQANSCLGWPDQHEIARIIYGRHSRFLLRYTVKRYQMSREERTEWIERFSRAKIDARLP